MKNRLLDLRNHLFVALEKLQDDEIEIERAKAIADVSRVLVDSAKAETEFLKVTGSARSTGFIEDEKPKQLSPFERKKIGHG